MSSLHIILGKVGFGNQIFIYSAANALARKGFKVRLVSDINTSDSVLSIHGSGSKNLRLESPRKFTYLNFYYFAKSKAPRYSTLIEAIFGVRKSTEISPQGNKKFSGTRIIEGYFQNIAWINSESEYLKEFLCQLPRSDSFEKIKPKSNSVTLGIHVRRGDYLGLRDSFGVLGADYYLNCVKELQIKEFDRVLIFSDDIEWCRRELQIRNDVEFISSQEVSSVIETHTLLGMCESLICSNSTFSISAAAIYKVPNVYVPNQLYVNPQIFEELSPSFPNRWKKMPSYWEIL